MARPKRRRTDPVTGLPLDGVDEKFLNVDGTICLDEIKAQYPGCTVIGLKQLGARVVTG
jgi:hypothetical protein